MEDWNLTDLFPFIAEPLLQRIIQSDPSWLLDRIKKEAVDGKLEVLTRVSLEFPNKAVSFDGCHTLDLALVLGNEVMPIEVKAGKTNLTAANFDQKLRPCGISLHKNQKKRITGNMLAILDRNFGDDLKSELDMSDGGSTIYAICHGARKPLMNEWILIARQKALGDLEKATNLRHKNKDIEWHKIHLEELCKSFRQDKFDLLVTDLLKGNNGYFKAWIETEPCVADDEQSDDEP